MNDPRCPSFSVPLDSMVVSSQRGTLELAVLTDEEGTFVHVRITSPHGQIATAAINRQSLLELSEIATQAAKLLETN